MVPLNPKHLGQTLVQVMVCRKAVAKLLPEPNTDLLSIRSLETNLSDIGNKIPSRCSWKYRLENGDHFVQTTLLCYDYFDVTHFYAMVTQQIWAAGSCKILISKSRVSCLWQVKRWRPSVKWQSMICFELYHQGDVYERHDVSNHLQLTFCSTSCATTQKLWNLYITGFLWGGSPFPSQMTSDVESVSTSWCLHIYVCVVQTLWEGSQVVFGWSVIVIHT